MRLTTLNKLFIQEVHKTEGVDASAHKSGRLQARLKRSYPVICFTKPSRHFASDTVFTETIAVEEVLQDVVKDASSEDSESSENININQPSSSVQAQSLRQLYHAAKDLKASMDEVPTDTVWPLTSIDMTLDKVKFVR